MILGALISGLVASISAGAAWMCWQGALALSGRLRAVQALLGVVGLLFFFFFLVHAVVLFTFTESTDRVQAYGLLAVAVFAFLLSAAGWMVTRRLTEHVRERRAAAMFSSALSALCAGGTICAVVMTAGVGAALWRTP